MEQLVKNSIRVYPGMIVVYPQFGMSEEELFKTEEVPKFNGMYNTNNSTVAFCYNNEFYCTPITCKAIRTLKKKGFVKGNLRVPFSNWEYPKKEKRRWDELRDLARKDKEDTFHEECIRYSKKHGIGTLSSEVLSNCMELPARGILVLKKAKNPYKETYYPIVDQVLDVTTAERLGRYSKNNGVVVFVYQDGKTMLTKGYGIINKLRSAGYQEASLYVPFSNNEEIVNPEIKRRWESINKK